MGREADARALAERERARAVFASNPQLFDRFGRPLMTGCELEYHDTLPPVYQIIDVKPDLRKNVPANAYLVTMRSTLIIAAVSNHPMDKTTLIQMPQVIADPAEDGSGAPADPASDDQAQQPQSSIVLTDMDRTAKATLAETITPSPPPPSMPLSLVPAPPAELPDPPPGHVLTDPADDPEMF